MRVDIQPLDKSKTVFFTERLNINPHQPYQPSSTPSTLIKQIIPPNITIYSPKNPILAP